MSFPVNIENKKTVDSKWSQLFVFLWVFGLWMLTRPYYGIWHDGLLYALQTIKVLHPELFQSDLYFSFGSQDSYTPFSRAFAGLASFFGLKQGAFILATVGGMFWVASLGYLSAQFEKNWVRALSLLLAVTYLPYYSGYSSFAYGESIVTPRIFSEAAALLAFGLLLRGRLVAAWLCVLISAVLHPLIALPAIVVAFLLSIKNWRTRLILIMLGLISAIVLALLHIGPFGYLLQTMDANWYEFLRLRSPFVFVDLWFWKNYSNELFVFAILYIGWMYGPEKFQKLNWAALVAASTGLAVAWLVGKYWHNVLLIELQTWRGLWVAQLLALLFFVPTARKLWQENFWGRALVVALVSAYLLRSEIVGLAALFSILIYMFGSMLSPDAKPGRVVLLLLLLIPLQALMWWAMGIKSELILSGEYLYRPSWSFGVTHTVLMASLIGLLAAISVFVGTRIRTLLLAIIGTGYFIAGLTFYDEESHNKWPFDSQSYLVAVEPVKARIPLGSTVYWESRPLDVWLGLGRSVYITQVQSSGAVFFRDNAIESKRRFEHVRLAGFRDNSWDIFKLTDYSAVKKPSSQGLASLCADPALDFVIINTALGGEELSFKLPNYKLNFYLYDCKKLTENPLTRKLRVTSAQSHTDG